MAEPVGFVGLGNMGRPMAARLAGAGIALTVHDLRAEVAERFVGEHGGRAAPDLPGVAAGNGVVMLMLPDGEAVRRVLIGDGGLTDAMASGALVVDMSSSAPVGTRDLGALLAERGLRLVDAPVSGGVARARIGDLAIMAGGAAADVDRCLPLFAAMGRGVTRTGPLGSGHALKALNNLLSASGLVAAAEVLLIGRRFGLDPKVMLDALNASTGRSNSTEHKFEQFVLSRTFASGFGLSLMVKDLRTALDLAGATSTPAVLGQATLDLWTEAERDLGVDADHTAVVAWLESVAGTRLAEGS